LATSARGLLPAFHNLRAGLLRRGAFHAAFGQAGALPNAVAEEVEFRATNDRGTDDFDLRDTRAVERELAFDAFAGDDATNGEHFGGTAAAARDDDAVEDLNAFFVAFENLAVNVDDVADFKFGNALFFSASFN
jgi:hypothetical protein